MRNWHAALCSLLIWMMPAPTVNFRTQEMSLIPPKIEPTGTPKTVTPKVVVVKPVTPKVTVPKVIPNSISGFFGQSKQKADPGTTAVFLKTVDDAQFLKDSTSARTLSMPYADDPKPSDLPHRHRYAPVQHAGLPQNMEVFPLQLENSDHELKFNVSWIPSTGGVAHEYSLEVWSLTETDDCQPRDPTDSPICYEYNIAGNVTWSLIPALSSTVAATCSIRPGCAYNVKLMPHPWDGHTIANLLVELEECVAGVCSCAHWPRLPTPVVHTQSVTIKDEIYSNISWTLPKPSYPQRLPSAKLRKQNYTVSIGKQMVAETISPPWFPDIKTYNVDAHGLVSEGDTLHFILFPISRQMELKAKLLAKVKLVDDRGCVGPLGYATVFDPAEVTKNKLSFGVYAILGALFGAWAMGAVFVMSARVVKRVLKSFRPAPVSAPLEPLRRRPAWFPLQLRT